MRDLLSRLAEVLGDPGPEALRPVPDVLGEQVPAHYGTYLLILRLSRERAVTFGRLGTFSCPEGHYLYVGSAFGSGGLRARLGRHLGGGGRRRWHVDYLRAVAEPVAAGWSTAPRRQECRWAQLLLNDAGVDVPAPGAGASDCSCRSHLFHVGVAK